MDISTLKPSNSFVPLVHPGTKEELGLVFEMRSRHADEVQEVVTKYTEKLTNRNGKRREPTPEESKQHNRQLILASIVGWEWTDPELTFEGEQPKYSRETLSKWLKDYPWMLEFFAAEFIDDGNFYK